MTAREPSPVRRLARRLARRPSTASAPVPASAPASAPAAARTPQPEHRPQYVLVVSYGRTGSTLVQGLLNTLPRSIVRGEHGLYLLPFFRAYHDLVGFRDKHLRHNPRLTHSAFYGLDLVRPVAFVRSARQLLHQSLLGDVRLRDVDVLGFKEVQWYRVREDEIEPFFAYVDRVLPDVRYVLNHRPIEQTLDSGFWVGRDRNVVMHRIERVLLIQQHLRETRPERCVDLPFAELTDTDPEVRDPMLRRLATFVSGSCDDELLEALRATASQRHGPPGGWKKERDERQALEALEAVEAVEAESAEEASGPTG